MIELGVVLLLIAFATIQFGTVTLAYELGKRSTATSQ